MIPKQKKKIEAYNTM